MWRPAEPDSGNSEAEGTCRAWARCEYVPPARQVCGYEGESRAGFSPREKASHCVSVRLCSCATILWSVREKASCNRTVSRSFSLI